MVWPGGLWPARWFPLSSRGRSPSLSLSAHHTLRPVTLGRWPLSGQSQTGQARPDTAAQQWTTRGHFVQSALLPLFLPSHNANHPSSAMAHFGHSQATIRKHNPQANLFWSIYTTWPAWNILYPSLHTSEDHPSHPCLIAIVDTLDCLKPIETNWNKPSQAISRMPTFPKLNQPLKTHCTMVKLKNGVKSSQLWQIFSPPIVNKNLSNFERKYF